MNAHNKLMDPLNRSEQVEGVVEFYSDEFKLTGPMFSETFKPVSMLYYIDVCKLAAYMFMRGDVAGYRYNVIRRYLEDMNAHCFDPDAPPI